MSNPDLFIRTPDGDTFEFGSNETETAFKACVLLMRCPWIELCERTTGRAVLWTAGERDERGCPRQIFIEDGDEMQVVLNS
jgi:hypothetical protein